MKASQRIFLKIQGGTRNTKYCVAVIESHKVPIHFYLTCMYTIPLTHISIESIYPHVY